VGERVKITRRIANHSISVQTRSVLKLRSETQLHVVHVEGGIVMIFVKEMGRNGLNVANV